MIIGVFSTDTFAFLAGKTFGKHKLAPIISPGKTIEGSLVGLLAGIITVMLASFILKLNLDIWQSLLLGFLIGIFSQIGDLIESLLKRLSKVKNSGHLLPGHGGILDRIDSIVLNAIIVYYFAIWVT
jgi:phosphatidate cytidylyltransferase